jgi:hypothetical protein
VSYRHWLEHRGSEGLADFLETSPSVTISAAQVVLSTEPYAPSNDERAYNTSGHPSVDTTPEEMARARPDLTTGELKMPIEE